MRFLPRRRIAGTPEPGIHDGPPVTRAGVLGADLRGVRPVLVVSEGDDVRAGGVLFTDRRHPEVAFVSPVSGIVESIQHGPRRSLSALVIRCTDTPRIEDSAPGEVRETLLSRGMWPAFRKRPFGGIPAPDAEAQAIFVNATRENPGAPDPRAVLEPRMEDFRLGLVSLTRLTEGPVHLCQAPGPGLIPPDGRVEVARFSSGLASAHVHRLHPVDAQSEVWTIGYQDVVAIGHLMRTGRYLSERVVAVGGAHCARLLRTVLGASLRDLTFDVAGEGAGVMSGPECGGREAAYLGRYHLQVSVGVRPREEPRSLRAIIPVAALDRALPIPTLAVPLMRALSIGDAETAERLGALSLVEEDMAEITRACTSGADYGRLLRCVLDELAPT